MTDPTVVTEYAQYPTPVLIDLLWKQTAKLKAAESKLHPLKATIDALETVIQHRLVTDKSEAVSTKLATASLRRTDVAELTDDKAFFAFVARTKSWDLVRKQVNVGAARERWNDGIRIPGVQQAVRVGLSLVARKK